MQETKWKQPKVKVKALDEGNCGAARSRGKEAVVKPTRPRTETGYEAGDADELAPHSEVRVSASQVKPRVVSGKSRSSSGYFDTIDPEADAVRVLRAGEFPWPCGKGSSASFTTAATIRATS